MQNISNPAFGGRKVNKNTEYEAFLLKISSFQAFLGKSKIDAMLC